MGRFVPRKKITPCVHAYDVEEILGDTTIKKTAPRVLPHAFKQHGQCDIMPFNKQRWCGNLSVAVILHRILSSNPVRRY